jgi:hypothetical protein
MLRNLVGDSTFFKVLDNYRDAHYFGTATTQDFINLVNSTSGQNYDWFFNQWIYGKGWVKYAAQTSWDSNNNEFTVAVQQQQDATWPTYKMPLEIKFFRNGFDSTVTVWDSLRAQSFSFILNSRPDSIQLDPNNKILNQIDTVFTSVDDDLLKHGFKLYQNYPNPFNPKTNIVYHLSTASLVTLKIYDLLGREIETLVDGLNEAGSQSVEWNAENFSSGIYFCRLTVTDGNRASYMHTNKLILLK